MSYKEYWMDKNGELDNGKCIVFEAHIKKPKSWDKPGEHSETSVHVIEIEALEAEKQRSQGLIEALEKIRDHDGHRHSMDTDEIARAALAKYRGE
jgi:hypothetical protein